MALGDSLAKGLAMRMIREESQRIVNAVRFGPGFNHPGRTGKWYKAVIRDVRNRVGKCLCYEGGEENTTKKNAKYVFIVAELSDDFLGFTAFLVDRKKRQVSIHETPMAFTIHLLQRLIQDGMEPTVDALVKRISPAMLPMLNAIEDDHPPGTKFKIKLEGGYIGCVVGKNGSIVARTWLPERILTDKQLEKFNAGNNRVSDP